MIYGQTGHEFTIFAACDSVYLRDHAKGFITSCAVAKNNTHLHITNPSDKDLSYIEFLKQGFKILFPEGSMTSSYDKIDISAYNKEQKRTFYACNRFIVADNVIKSNVLILDIDCLVMTHIQDLNCDIGLYLRQDEKFKEWDGLGGKIAAGAVYINKNNLDFVIFIKEFIAKNKLLWCLDQVAVYKAYLNFDSLNYILFDNKFMDWEFKKDTVIWTGKGTRKSLNAIYTKKHKDFRKLFPLEEDK